MRPHIFKSKVAYPLLIFSQAIDVSLHVKIHPDLCLFFFFSRVAVRKDSCSIVAISLNIQEKVHPIIWSLASLPFDSLQVIPIPKPIGEILYFFFTKRGYTCTRK